MPKLQLVEEGIIFRNPNPGYRYIMSAFSHPVQLPDGDLVCSYNRGQALYATDLAFYQTRSRDGGASWDEHALIHDSAQDDRPYSYHDPFLTLLRDGSLVIAAFRVDRSDPDKPIFNEATGGLIDLEVILLRSHDGGRSWSAPQEITLPPDMSLTPSTGIVELSSGEWFLPCDRWHAFDEPGPYRPATVGLFSRDQGRTWGDPITFAATFADDDAAQDKGFWHGKIVRLDDGKLLTLFWAADLATGRNLTLHRCLGSADGREWRAPEPTNLPGQTNHVAQIEGDLLAAIYTQREGAQPGFRVVLSQDCGQNWDVEDQLLVWDATGRDKLGIHAPDAYPRSHDTIAFGAPTALRLHDGDLLVSFWCTEMSITHVRCARLRVV